MIYLVDEIEKVVVAMRSDPKVLAIFGGNFSADFSIDFDSVKGLAPFYKYGHKVEIANSLIEKDKDMVYKYQKYPLVALRMDFDEQPGSVWDFTLNIAIVMITGKNFPSQERYTRVFKPVLYPLYQSFFRQLKAVGKFTWEGELNYPPHTKTDRPFYGTTGSEGNEAYTFNDPLDAIEITNLKISKRDVCP